MNEYITWSEELKMFSDSLSLKELIKDIKETWDDYEVEESKFFQYIGLYDCTDRKIYADCTIVELFLGLDSFIGYYSFNPKAICYEFIVIEGCENMSLGNRIGSKIKIIDTIQENKLGLIK